MEGGKLYISGTVIAAVALGVATAAVAAEYKNADALSVGRKASPDCSIKEDVETKTYCFGDEASRAAFMKDFKGRIAKG